MTVWLWEIIREDDGDRYWDEHYAVNQENPMIQIHLPGLYTLAKKRTVTGRDFKEHLKIEQSKRRQQCRTQKTTSASRKQTPANKLPTT